MKIKRSYFFTVLILCVLGCAKSNGGTTNNGNNGNNGNTDTAKKGLPVSFWVTTTNQNELLQRHTDMYFGTATNNFPFIDVDSANTFQTIDGFGFTLTGGSAAVINTLNATDKAALLQELFATTGNTAIGISYLRISIGASDLNASVFSYDDMPAGQTDETMAHFSLANDATDLIPLLKEILAINPAIKIIATPWSAPVWMKDNGSTTGGSLVPAYYAAYASYFVQYIQAMQAQGIGITAVTPQNEPLNPNNNPSLYMTALQQAAFIKNNLGPAFQQAGISTKIVAYDHNCDVAAYPLAVLGDAAANAYTDGSAFHLYAGDISTLSSVHNSYPDKNIYFTEQYTASTGDFGGDLNWHIKNVVIGSMRNWSRNALEWNLANDAAYGPHTPGGCTTCKGALTINGSVTRNVAYYIIAHASKFVPAGSVRIESTISGNLNNVAFLTPGGKKVLLVQNTGSEVANFNIRYKSSWVPATLAGGAVATYTW